MENTSQVPTTSTPEVQSTDKAKDEKWLLRQEIEADLRAVLREEYLLLFQIWKDNDLAELEKRNRAVIEEGLQKLFDNWKEKQQPPTDDDLQKILNQEYKEFTVQVMVHTDSEGDEEPKIEKKDFVIRELPSAIERKFFNTFKSKLLDKASVIQATVQADMEAPFEEKLRKGLGLFEDAFDILADSVVMCLNPFGKKAYVTREWVQANISLDRQWRIVESQIGVNRLRDFFSKISQSGQMMTTTLNGVSFQQLEQLSR